MKKVGILLAAAVGVVVEVVGGSGRAALASKVDYWTDGSGDGLWNTTSLNWSSGGVAAAYADGDQVIFGDVAAAGQWGNVMLGQVVNPGTLTVQNDSTNYVWQGAGSLSGAANAVVVKAGVGVLTIRNSTANGRTGVVAVYAGNLVEDVSALASATNLLSTSDTLQAQGGNFVLQGTTSGAGASAQTFGLEDVRGGYSEVEVFNGTGTGTTLQLTNVNRESGGLVDFVLGANATVMTEKLNGTGGILGGWATVAGTDWAVSAGNGTRVGAITALGSYTNDVWAAGNNTDVTGNETLSDGATTNTVRFDGNADVTVTLGNGTNTVASGGILMTPNVGAHNVTITSGAGNGTITGNGGRDLMLIQNDMSGVMTVDAPVVDSVTPAGAVSLTVSGAGKVVLTSTNSTYSGVTTINGGTLQVPSIGNGGQASALGVGVPVVAYDLKLIGGTLRVMQASTTNRVIGISSPGGTIDAEGPVAFTANATMQLVADVPATLTLTGSDTVGSMMGLVLADPDSSHRATLKVVKNGPGVWSLTAGNVYTGGTVVNGGTLLVNNSTLGTNGTGSGVVTLNGGTLGGTGSVGAVVAGSGPHVINPGLPGAVGQLSTLSVTGNGNTTLAFDLRSPEPGGTGSSNSDLLVSSNVTLNGSAFAFSMPAITHAQLGYYQIIEASLGGLQLNGVTVPTLGAGLVYTLDGTREANFLDVHLGFLGDANDDGTVDLSDLSIVLNNFGSTTTLWSNGNFDGAATVDLTDLSDVLNAFGSSAPIAPGPSEVIGGGVSAAPEPGSLGLMGMVVLLARRRRVGAARD